MIYDRRDRVRVRNGVLAVTTIAWILLVWSASLPAGAHVHHHGIRSGALASTAANWLLMLAAMMAPVLIQPIQFVRGNGLARRRGRTTLLFVTGYGAVWTLAGALLLALAGALGSSGLSPSVYVAAVFLAALLWQCSPAKQACLNRCHAVRALAAFGRTADTDAFVFGATQGTWCAGSCWAWMLLPLLLPGGHIVAMAAATILILCERLDEPAPVGWRWRGLGRARRIVAVRVKLWTSVAA